MRALPALVVFLAALSASAAVARTPAFAPVGDGTPGTADAAAGATAAPPSAGELGDPAGACVEAARIAARRHGVPEELLQAIALVESGRTVRGRRLPWPWTVNAAGRGYWFPARGEALARARAELAAGRRSFDLGCFQINYRWHGHAFAGLEEMLDPGISADYAARHLAALARETGDWLEAASFYHSRTPQLAARYRGLVQGALARLARVERSRAPVATGLAGPGGSAAPIRVAAAPAPRPSSPRMSVPDGEEPAPELVGGAPLAGGMVAAASTSRARAAPAAPAAVPILAFAAPATAPAGVSAGGEAAAPRKHPGGGGSGARPVGRAGANPAPGGVALAALAAGGRPLIAGFGG